VFSGPIVVLAHQGPLLAFPIWTLTSHYYILCINVTFPNLAVFNPENASDMSLRDVDTHLKDYKMLS
jgi:hypothetical protein